MFNDESTPDYKVDLLEYLEREFRSSENYLSTLNIKTSLMTSQDNMEHQYDFLQAVVGSDSGTAGKECQEIFRKFLRDYLDPEVEIVMDGRVFLGRDIESPQLDIILVKDMPPVVSRTYVPVQYVIAAFEVKLTLVPGHLEKIHKTAQKLRLHHRTGTAREELVSPIVYGVLALSSKFTPATRNKLSRTLATNDAECTALIKKLESLGPPSHPAKSIDLLLVADAFSIVASKTINYSEKYPADWLPDVQLCYRFSISSHRLAELEDEQYSMMWRYPGHSHIGAFLSGLYLLLWREGAISERNPSIYYDFDSRILAPIYGWSIDTLGAEFKKHWIANIEDETNLEWAWTHPQ
ncbi:DUF6602 domain-containing protein [Pseudomonas brassicacearum]|uniref:DUF6602 domain-containing protein n=1 Tax=Pseudomonas brassicacearum TaxID=930166 RepID=UPI001D3EDE76|nr:DUF6602 domain-containing protein [Pseudomonas brassicacearum]CAH0267296.1 hypothetical protein SRABI06_03565 [Pseudomonas brassicacearum]